MDRSHVEYWAWEQSATSVDRFASEPRRWHGPTGTPRSFKLVQMCSFGQDQTGSFPSRTDYLHLWAAAGIKHTKERIVQPLPHPFQANPSCTSSVLLAYRPTARTERGRSEALHFLPDCYDKGRGGGVGTAGRDPPTAGLTPAGVNPCRGIAINGVDGAGKDDVAGG